MTTKKENGKLVAEVAATTVENVENAAEVKMAEVITEESIKAEEAALKAKKALLAKYKKEAAERDAAAAAAAKLEMLKSQHKEQVNLLAREMADVLADRRWASAEEFTEWLKAQMARIPKAPKATAKAVKAAKAGSTGAHSGDGIITRIAEIVAEAGENGISKDALQAQLGAEFPHRDEKDIKAKIYSMRNYDRKGYLLEVEDGRYYNRPVDEDDAE